MSSVRIVVPCFNEAKRFDADAFRRFDGPYSFLFVDDGSTDGTAEVLAELVASDPERFALLGLERNSGKAEAVRRGILEGAESGASIVGYFDADLATPLDELGRLLEELERDDALVAVLGARVRLLGRHIERGLGRHYAGRVFATFASLTVDLPLYDTQCGAKVFRADATVLEAFAEPFLAGWAFDVEVIARLAQRLRAAGVAVDEAIIEVPLQQWFDVPGSKVRLLHGLRAFIDLLGIRRRYR